MQVKDFKEYNTWLAQRRFKLRNIQSFNVPFNSIPLAKVLVTLNPDSVTSCCKKSDKRLLQVIIIRLGRLKDGIAANLTTNS